MSSSAAASSSSSALPSLYLASPPTSPASLPLSHHDDDSSIDQAVRKLMNELDQSIFKNVSSALSTFFLDVNNPGHFVSMPHLGFCASPESNVIMRLIEESLSKAAIHLMDPTHRKGLARFGDWLAHRVSCEPRVLSPLSKILIVLRLGHTATAARSNNHHTDMAAMVLDYPLFVDAQVQVQSRPMNTVVFPISSSSSDNTTAPTTITSTNNNGSTSLSRAISLGNRNNRLVPSTSTHNVINSNNQFNYHSNLNNTSYTNKFNNNSPRSRTMSLPVIRPMSIISDDIGIYNQTTGPQTEIAVVVESMSESVPADSPHPVYILHVRHAPPSSNNNLFNVSGSAY